MKDVRRIAKTARLEFVARIAWELIVQAYANRINRIQEEIFLGGFSWGAQMMGAYNNNYSIIFEQIKKSKFSYKNTITAILCRMFHDGNEGRGVPIVNITRTYGMIFTLQNCFICV